MFRKIPSEKKNTTVFEELKNEFSPQFESMNSKAKGFMEGHPKVIFSLMIITILVSFILSFFVLKPSKDQTEDSFKQELNSVSGSLSGEFSALQQLSIKAAKIAELKAEIERIISQKSISEIDSIYLEKAIEELQYFNDQSKQDEN